MKVARLASVGCILAAMLLPSCVIAPPQSALSRRYMEVVRLRSQTRLTVPLMMLSRDAVIIWPGRAA